MRDADDPEQTHLTTAQAAAVAHVTEAVIRKWRDRGLLIPVDPAAEHKHYREIDVLRAEAATRREPRRRALTAAALETLDQHDDT